MASQHSFDLAKNGKLVIKIRLGPNRSALFQNEDYNGYILGTPVSKKGKNKPKEKGQEEDWRFKTTARLRFDLVL